MAEHAAQHQADYASKLTELQNRLNSQMDYLEQAADTAFLDLNDLDGTLLFDENANSVLKYGNITQSLYLLRQVYDDIGVRRALRGGRRDIRGQQHNGGQA